jgi:hypothetical protein
MLLISLFAAGLHLAPSPPHIDFSMKNRAAAESFEFLGMDTGRVITLDKCVHSLKLTVTMKHVAAQQVFDEIARLLALEYEDDGKEIKVHCAKKPGG